MQYPLYWNTLHHNADIEGSIVAKLLGFSDAKEFSEMSATIGFPRPCTILLDGNDKYEVKLWKKWKVEEYLKTIK